MNTTNGPIRRAAAPVRWYHTIIVGGGQAGLATGHHLAKHDVDFVILDAGRRIGDSWRDRWDSLRLFTPARYSGLPGMPFPDSPAHLPDKDQVADYLELYADRFDLPVITETAVQRLEQTTSGFVLRTTNGTYTSDNVVVATGPFQRPHIPAMASRLGEDIHQLHSRDYRNPFELPDGPVLVVGAGNSGAQIALELSRHHAVTLAGRDVGGLPRTILGMDVFHWVWPVFQHLHIGTRLGRRLQRRTQTSDPLIGIGPDDFESHGVRRVGPVTGVVRGLPSIGGVPVGARTVIWATGFTQDFNWITVPKVLAEGAPLHRRGVSDVRGIYFAGLKFQYRRSSALLGGVGADAEFIAAQIVRRGVGPWFAEGAPTISVRSTSELRSSPSGT